jgi:hypothetical protein
MLDWTNIALYRESSMAAVKKVTLSSLGIFVDAAHVLNQHRFLNIVMLIKL